MLMRTMEGLVRTLRSLNQCTRTPLWIQHPKRASRLVRCNNVRQRAHKANMSWIRHPSQESGEREISQSTTSRSEQTTISRSDYVTQNEEQAQQSSVLRCSTTSAGRISRYPQLPSRMQIAIPREVV